MQPTSASTSLTAHLTSLATPRPYTAATQHPFLTAAGTGTLPLARLSCYLAQDRIYAAHGYPRLIGHLLARIPFAASDGPASDTEARHTALVGVLADALQGVRREVVLFAEIVDAYGMPPLGAWRERKATRDYTAEMARVGACATPEEGLVLLWAMEHVYLDAWKYVKSLLPNIEAGEVNPALAATRKLVDNWTSSAFEQFVADLANIVDGLGIKACSPTFKHVEEIWARVIELEEAFWPEASENYTLDSTISEYHTVQ